MSDERDEIRNPIEAQAMTPMGTTGRPAPAQIERYTEADIAQLEHEDLTDLTVIAKLREAYRQNDPNEEEFFPGFRRDPTHTLIGREESFAQRIAEAEAELQSNPTDYMARTKRLYAMAGREMMRRREELRARHPELCALWRMRQRGEAHRGAKDGQDR